MAHDEAVARRLRSALVRARPAEPVDERKMFGGLALMVGGSMACGVLGDELVIRVAEADAAAALRRAHARPMDFTGRPMRGFLYVAPAGFASDEDLDGWVALALAGARAAAKRPGAAKSRTRRPAPRRAQVVRAR
jgi:TfoX/Sxy family transcriptional regulator of competence genes